jgi:hypothetical protein
MKISPTKPAARPFRTPRTGRPIMEATTRLLHSSALGSVMDFRCRCAHERPSEREYTPRPWITFVRRGAFNYREGRQASDFHSGVVLLGSGRAEYVVRPGRALRRSPGDTHPRAPAPLDPGRHRHGCRIETAGR